MPQIIPPPAQDKREMWELDQQKDPEFKSWLSKHGTDFLLNIEDEGEQLSNCCGAEILMPDENGHGRCAECKENCVPEEEVCPECGETAETGACYFYKQD